MRPDGIDGRPRGTFGCRDAQAALRQLFARGMLELPRVSCDAYSTAGHRPLQAHRSGQHRETNSDAIYATSLEADGKDNAPLCRADRLFTMNGTRNRPVLKLALRRPLLLHGILLSSANSTDWPASGTTLTIGPRISFVGLGPRNLRRYIPTCVSPGHSSPSWGDLCQRTARHGHPI